MLKIIDLARKAPPMIADNEHVKSLQCGSQDAWCWGRESLAAINLAIQNRQEYSKEVSDVISFTLGLTPTPPDGAPWDEVANIASHYSADNDDQQAAEQVHQEVD
nr:hypothetical protein Iba_chr06bCG12710 [Ipomoea batatas]